MLFDLLCALAKLVAAILFAFLGSLVDDMRRA